MSGSSLLSRLRLAFAGLAVFAAPAVAFDLQGHRGTRGLEPENTLPAFVRALDIGVTTLETDLALTKDGVLVLTHDRRLNPDLTRDASGKWLEDPGPLIKDMTFAALAEYDVGRLKPGSRYAAQWPDQQGRDGVRVPRFTDLVDLIRQRGTSVRLNIETKLSADAPSETADPEIFAKAVVAAVRENGLTSRTTIQSFDWRTLRAAKRLAPEIATACLTISAPTFDTLKPASTGGPSPWLGGLDPKSLGGSIPRLVAAAGCSIWSPFWRNLDAASVTAAQALGLKVIPWTVNTTADMANVIALGVDGLITDYPDRGRAAATTAGKVVRVD